MSLQQSPMFQHSEPYLTAYRVDSTTTWTGNTGGNPNDMWNYAVNPGVEYLNGGWCTGVKVSQGGNLRMKLRGMPDNTTILMPLLAGELFRANIEYLLPYQSDVSGIIALG